MNELKEKAPVLQPGVRVLTIGLDKVAPRHNGRLCTILDADPGDPNLPNLWFDANGQECDPNTGKPLPLEMISQERKAHVEEVLAQCANKVQMA